MSEKPQPLDLDFKTILEIIRNPNAGDYTKAYAIENYVKQQIKEAVRGLIKDVQARMHKNCDCDVCMKLSWVIDDIKKWFYDIFRENEKE